MNRKRRNFDNFWNFNFDEIFQSFQEDMDAMMKSASSEYQEDGPITFGYSFHVGPDTEYQPEIRQWGNLNDFRRKQGLPELKLPFGLSSRLSLPTSSSLPIDHYIDIIDEENYLKIIVEVPGFTKDNLNVEVNELGSEITLKGESKLRKLNKTIQLPSKIEAKTTKSSIKNGVLEIRGKKIEKSSKKFKLKID
ncbi:MAG: Hsp20/alpha crystallin family protein [Candidatus Hermodarchaeota archaeon]